MASSLRARVRSRAESTAPREQGARARARARTTEERPRAARRGKGRALTRYGLHGELEAVGVAAHEEDAAHRAAAERALLGVRLHAHTPPLHTHGLAFRRPCQPWPIAALAVQHGKRKTRHPGNGPGPGRGKGRARISQSSAAHSALCARRTPSLRPCLARSTLGRWLACVRASERQSVRVRRPSECVRGRSPPRRPRPFARRPQPIR